MQAGRRDRQVQFLRATTSRNTAGEEVPTWAALGNPVWAGLKEAGGREALSAEGLSAEVDAVFTLERHVPDFTEQDRIRDLETGRVHDIKMRRELPGHVGWEVMASYVESRATAT